MTVSVTVSQPFTAERIAVCEHCGALVPIGAWCTCPFDRARQARSEHYHATLLQRLRPSPARLPLCDETDLSEG